MRISDWSSDVCSSDLDDVAFARGARLLDQRIVAVEDSRLDHRIARYFERIMFARTEQRGGDGEVVVILERLDRHARGDLAVQRHFDDVVRGRRSEEHTSELQSLMRISYAVFCLNKKTTQKNIDEYLPN